MNLYNLLQCCGIVPQNETSKGTLETAANPNSIGNEFPHPEIPEGLKEFLDTYLGEQLVPQPRGQQQIRRYQEDLYKIFGYMGVVRRCNEDVHLFMTDTARDMVLELLSRTQPKRSQVYASLIELVQENDIISTTISSRGYNVMFVKARSASMPGIANLAVEDTSHSFKIREHRRRT